MKSLLILPVFILMFNSGHCQKSTYQKEVYYDETGKQINQELFNLKLDYEYNLPKTFMNDSLIVRMLVSRETYGTIAEEHEEQFRQLLSKSTGDNTKGNKTIIINFFFEHKNCLDIYLNDRSYLRKVEKEEQLIQYFMTDKTFDYDSSGPKVYKDVYDIVRRLFFKYEFVCGNYVIIKPDGRYYRYYGEYDQSDIVKKATSDWDIIED